VSAGKQVTVGPQTGPEVDKEVNGDKWEGVANLLVSEFITGLIKPP